MADQPKDPPKDLAALMAQVLAMNEQRTSGQPVTTTKPTTQPSALEQAATQMLTSGGGGSEPLSTTVAAMRNTPVQDFMAQRQITNQQALDATATEDVAKNAGMASQLVAQEFPGQSPGMFPTGISKTYPNGGTLTAFPSGGYGFSRTAAEQDALVAARKANFAKNVAGTSAGAETLRRFAANRNRTGLPY